MGIRDMPADWEAHAYPGLPEVRLLRSIYGLCADCDHERSAHKDNDHDGHVCAFCPERAAKPEGYEVQCVCGNTPADDGFQPCLPDGTVVEPTAEDSWEGRLYLCWRCGRVIDQENLVVTGRGRLDQELDW